LFFAVASNNLAVLNRDQNLFDLWKRVKTATAPETEPKLNTFQKEKHCSTCDYLRNDNESSVKPGIVATLVTLYNYMEDSKSTGQVLNESVDRLLARKLLSIKQLSEGIDADMLESTLDKRIPKSEKTIEKTKVDDSGSKSTSAVAIVRLPKKYDPTSKPDPQFSLPLCEHSYYRSAVGSDQSATNTITTSTGAQKSMSTSKTTTGTTSTEPKSTPSPGNSTTGKRKGKPTK
ncbi:unnamed protein product, partial [Rotaria sp. Silwood1]